MAVPGATRPGGPVAPSLWGVGCQVGGGGYIKGGRYRLSLMSTLIPADQALAILRAAGVNAAKSPARGRCRTLCYLVGGQYVNLGRLRELAREAQAAQAEPARVVAEPEAEAVAHLCRKFPISTPATWIPAVARLQARGAAVTVGAILRETERPAPVLPGEARPGAAPEPLAQVEVDPYKRGEWQRTGIGPDPVAVAERRAARWAERNPEHSYRVVVVAPRPVLPGETEPPAPVAQDGPAPDLPNLATPAPTGDGWAGQPWDPGTPEARARVAQQGERVATLWPIAQAVKGAGFDLPPVWWADGPILAGERTYGEALAALPLGAIAAAAAALAALPPVTAAQDRALRLCRGDLAAV